jgi:aminoglycoside phosphotransferase (APT) family kinase protein
MADSNPTIKGRAGEALDLSVIDPLLKEAIPGLSGQAVVTQYPSGASNLTYAIDYPERRLVLRRPPFGKIPKGGHDMFREYRIMRDLKPAFSAVPPVQFYTDDESYIGKEFYVMDRVDGHILHRIPEEWTWGEAENRALCEEFFSKLCDLHTLDVEAAGLSDFGRPEGYVERQIKGWNRRWNRVLTDDVPHYEDVQAWLETNMPKDSGKVGVLHGDYRIDNCILNPDDPTKISAIIDWEISALGDPLMDLGNTLAYWIQADDPPHMQLTVRQPCTNPGMMTRQEILEFYADRTGYDVSDMAYYYVYGIWRLCVIIQQIYFRYVSGSTQDERFKNYGQMVMALAETAREKIKTGDV